MSGTGVHPKALHEGLDDVHAGLHDQVEHQQIDLVADKHALGLHLPTKALSGWLFLHGFDYGKLLQIP